MPVPFGFGVGDFVAVGTLAWRVYKAAKDAPEAFHNIHNEVLSLHVVSREIEETVFQSPLPPQREARLKVVFDGCMETLKDLEKLVEKYQNMDRNSKRTWDRLRWCREDINEFRARLNNNVTLMTAMITTCQFTVGKKLDEYLEECQSGKREGSVISAQTGDSLTVDERALWRDVRKELEDIGITLAAWESNRDFILSRIKAVIPPKEWEECDSRQDQKDESEDSSMIPSNDTLTGNSRSDEMDTDETTYSPNNPKSTTFELPSTTYGFTGTTFESNRRSFNFPRTSVELEKRPFEFTGTPGKFTERYFKFGESGNRTLELSGTSVRYQEKPFNFQGPSGEYKNKRFKLEVPERPLTSQGTFGESRERPFEFQGTSVDSKERLSRFLRMFGNIHEDIE